MGQKLRIKNKLTSLSLKKITQPGRYSDGNNLYLKVEETGSRRWILRLSINGKRRDMGLGSFSFINLNDARELAEKYNKLAKSGIDPGGLSFVVFNLFLNSITCTMRNHTFFSICCCVKGKYLI